MVQEAQPFEFDGCRKLVDIPLAITGQHSIISTLQLMVSSMRYPARSSVAPTSSSKAADWKFETMKARPTTSA
jgi:hypothetical protein